MKKLSALLSAVLLLTLSAWAQDPIVLKGNELFGAISARQIGPALMSGRITDIAGHPTNNRVIYVGTAGGGVWKSSDGGLFFTSIFDDYNQSIGCIAIDPNKPDNVIWVGTGETWTRNSVSYGDGLYKSTDGGSNWKKMGFENSDRISSIVINPNNSDEVYVGVLGALWGDSNERGVYKTTDGGATWERLLAGTNNTGCSDLVMDPKDPNTLYASFWEFRRTAYSFSSGGANSALYKSTDGGKNWVKIHKGFPAGPYGRIAFTLAPSNPSIQYAVVEAKEDKGLYRSDDAGASWTKLNGDFGLTVRPFYFSRIVVDPRNPDVVYKGGLYGSVSLDGGKTFKNMGAMHADIHDIWIDLNDSDRLYVGTDGGVYRSYNAGTTLEMVGNLPVSQFYHVSLDNEEPYNVYGGLQDNGSWYGPSSSPSGIEARDWSSVGAGDGFRVLRHPTKKIIYSEMQGAENIWRFDIERNQTKVVKPFPTKGEPKYRFNWNAPIELSPNQPDRLYVGSQFLMRSNDMGDNWEKISPDLTTNDPAKQMQANSGGISVDNSGAENHCTIFTIAESPLDENVIWVGTDDGNVQLTQNGGKTWTNVVANIPELPKNTWCYHIEASNFDKGIAYAVFDGHTRNDMKPYAYKTTDFGKTWTSIITPDVHGFARNIQEDYVNQDLLFLGTELGLFVTIDGGKNWSKFTNNMPAASVHYLALHPKTNDLVVATHGRGIIIIDDISPLRQINQEVLQKEVHFFKSPTFVMSEQSSFGGTSTETQYVGPNPNPNAKIVYYLKKRHTFGAMSMEVVDSEGNKVSVLDPGKQKGINIVTWSYITRMPKTAKGKTFAFGGFAAPRVPAGSYKVVMKKGKETFEHPIEVSYDPQSLIPVESRKLQQEMVQKLFDMTESLAYTVHEVDALIDYANAALAKDPKSAKTINAFLKEINTLKEGLVITTGDNYVGSAEPQLREKISNLYSVVVSNYDKPSNTQYENYEELETRYNKALADLGKIKTKHWKNIEKVAAAQQLTAFSLESKEDFLKQ
ncbi:hypothetical protein QWY31_03235 [Cytophagales bacterium LB-30]|uniref:Sortilin N-terminal domain-containing protein n=1 Tax=Shiella aurantiaca TaxID=3058365 RepID=A0ABT8F220_9BACT|nr:hypothetical protein [Shiella aurantiaca]MDN4164497.1 hypothetical protein [Shiella aurantiaca]